MPAVFVSQSNSWYSRELFIRYSIRICFSFHSFAILVSFRNLIWASHASKRLRYFDRSTVLQDKMITRIIRYFSQVFLDILCTIGKWKIYIFKLVLSPSGICILFFLEYIKKYSYVKRTQIKIRKKRIKEPRQNERSFRCALEVVFSETHRYSWLSIKTKPERDFSSAKIQKQNDLSPDLRAKHRRIAFAAFHVQETSYRYTNHDKCNLLATYPASKRSPIGAG